MKSRVYSLLNIKPAEAGVVKQLFLVQLFLGIATSFLFTSALTLFLATYSIKELPKVSLLTAGLLVVANLFYARLEVKVSAKKLLQIIILLSLGSILITWLEATFFSVAWLPFFISAWNMVIYMVVGYAFWGMAAIIFNVRESKRIFSVVGSGDIPAKTLGYAAVAVLAPVIGVVNVLALSIVAFSVAYYYLTRFEHPAIEATPGRDKLHGSGPPAAGGPAGLMARLFENQLIFVIAGWSFVGFIIYALIDYTFLTAVKIKFTTSHELASFLGIFFAIGRVLSMFLKLIFSSRVINRLGLTNSLLITPAVLAVITGFTLLAGTGSNVSLTVFGMMVLISEVLKSAVQEPAFFVLFQPLPPHARLKGHLITKGYTLPFALLAVGIFALLFRDARGEISITLVSGTLLFLIAVWSAGVFFIKTEYLRTLIQALKKGYFTGSQLFLTGQPVRYLLLSRIKSGNPQEILFALELLERSGYQKLDDLLLVELNSSFLSVKKFVLARLMQRNSTAALPVIRQQIAANGEPELKPELIKALFYLNPLPTNQVADLVHLDPAGKKAALLGLAARPDAPVAFLKQEVTLLATSHRPEDKLLALEIMAAVPNQEFYALLQSLLQEPTSFVYKTAIEAVGQLRGFKLWPEAVAAARKHHATGALQKSILHFGDAIFAPEYMAATALPATYTLAVIKTAGNITGSFSTAYLLDLLESEPAFSDPALAALFRKKAGLTNAGVKKIVSWLEIKLRQCQRKIRVYAQSATHPAANMLTTAIRSEVNQDLKLILRALALIYDRPRLERVLHLLSIRDDARLSNAIELLEWSIPKKYFLQADVIFEFLLDSNVAKTEYSTNPAATLTPVVQEIITAPGAGFNVWTKSVALYLVPSLPNQAFHIILKDSQPEEMNPLFSETKKFVLTQVEI